MSIPHIDTLAHVDHGAVEARSQWEKPIQRGGEKAHT